MISRRSILQYGMTATALASIAAATVQCQPIEAPAATVDPIFAEIERHRAARARFNDAIDFSDDDPDRYEAENRAEKEAWDSFAITHPTTMAGVAAMAAYALHSPMGAEEDNLREVLRTIVVMTAKFAHQPGGSV